MSIEKNSYKLHNELAMLIQSEKIEFKLKVYC